MGDSLMRSGLVDAGNSGEVRRERDCHTAGH